MKQIKIKQIRIFNIPKSKLYYYKKNKKTKCWRTDLKYGIFQVTI